MASEPVEAADLPRHSLSVMLFPDRLYAEVSEDKLGAVTFGGNVTVDKPQGIEPVTVTLSCSCDMGWPSVVSPHTIEFLNPGTVRFSMTVIVPPGTPPVMGSATVYASAESTIWESEEYSTVGVMVLQYYQFDLLYDANTDEAEPGGSADGVFKINNTSNGEDSFNIRVREMPSYVSRVEMDETVTALPGTMMDVDFTFYIKEDVDVPFEGLLDVVTFVVTSAGAEKTGEPIMETFDFYIGVKGLGQDLMENWPTYTGYAVAAVLAATITIIVFRKWRRRQERAVDLHRTG